MTRSKEEIKEFNISNRKRDREKEKQYTALVPQIYVQSATEALIWNSLSYNIFISRNNHLFAIKKYFQNVTEYKV